MPTPNPGTPEAIDAGCTCPVMDNNHGQGVPTRWPEPSEPSFWFSKGCPVHDPQETSEP